MKAVYFESFGVENLKFGEVEIPKLQEGYSLIKVLEATLNPIDFFTVEGRRKVSPIPHIPGVEIYGEVVEGTKKGKRVVVYPRIFCGECKRCVSSEEMICTMDIFGVATNGGFSQYALVPDKNIFEISERVPRSLCASLPVGALTAYHALRFVEQGEDVAVFGSTGNTGTFSVQIAKIKGCRVFAITRKKAEWLYDFGADEVLTPSEAEKKLKGKCSTVIDPLGKETFGLSLSLLSPGGKFITFGILTGDKVNLPLFEIYSKHISILGVTGGSRRDFIEVISLAERGLLKIKVWKEFSLEQIKEAFRELKNPNREGKISIVIER